MDMIEKVARAILQRRYPMTRPEDIWLDPAAIEDARAAIEAMRDPSLEMLQAAYEAMFVDKWDGTQAPMVGAGFDAAIEEALTPQPR